MSDERRAGNLESFIHDLYAQPQMRKILVRQLISNEKMAEAVVKALLGGDGAPDEGVHRVPPMVFQVLQQFMSLPEDLQAKYAQGGELPPGSWLPATTNGSKKS